MKRPLLISILLSISIQSCTLVEFFQSDSLVHSSAKEEDITNQVTTDTVSHVASVDKSMELSDSLAYTTALINALNNALTAENNNLNKITVIIGILGLVFAIASVISYYYLKNDIMEYKKEDMF